jgi:hypothetical protein
MSRRQAESAMLDLYPVAKDIEKTKGFLTKMGKAVLGLKKGGSVGQTALKEKKNSSGSFFGKVSKIKNI